MNNNAKRISIMMGAVLGVCGLSAQAAVLSTGNLLGIGAGSWFAVDIDGNGSIDSSEQAGIAAGADGGLVIGATQSVGAIDTWTWLERAGAHYTTIAPTGGTTTGIDFSGWSIFWDGAPVSTTYDFGAWTPGNCDTLGCTGVSFEDHVAAFSWSGAYGDSYSLWYAWTFTGTDPGCFCSTDYVLHLEGVVTETAVVPLPSAFWLLGGGLAFLLRRCSA